MLSVLGISLMLVTVLDSKIVLVPVLEPVSLHLVDEVDDLIDVHILSHYFHQPIDLLGGELVT